MWKEGTLDRIIMHYDMDAFFASVEIREKPWLADKPVIVGTNVVTTCNYVARKYGIHSAMSTAMARRLCKNGVYLRVDKDLYQAESDRIKELVLRITDKVEFIALDEGYIDISEIAKKYTSLEYFAEKFKKGIKRHTGLTCSVGVGFNKLSAKMASEVNKPDGMHVFKDEDEFIDYVRQKDIGIIPGIGKKTAQFLKETGICKVEDGLKIPLQQMRSILGYSKGDMVYEYMRGVDRRAVKNSRKIQSISNETTFNFPVDESDIIEKEIAELFKKTYKRLLGKKLHCKTVTIKIRYENRETITRSKSFDGLEDQFTKLWETLVGLKEHIDFSRKIRLVGVALGNVAKKHGEQLSLTNVNSMKRKNKIEKLKNSIRRLEGGN